MIPSRKLLKAARVAIVILVASSVRTAHAVDCSVPTNNFGISEGTSFNISMSGFTSSDIQTAAAYWGCPSI